MQPASLAGAAEGGALPAEPTDGLDVGVEEDQVPVGVGGAQPGVAAADAHRFGAGGRRGAAVAAGVHLALREGRTAASGTGSHPPSGGNDADRQPLPHACGTVPA